MNWLIGLILITVGIVFVGFLLRRSTKRYTHETAEEKARRTVEEILIETKQVTKEELKEMDADEKIQRWMELYGEKDE